MPGALSPLLSRSSSGTSSFGAPSSGSVKAEFDNSVDTATSSDVNTIEDQAVLAAAALAQLFLASYQTILDPKQYPKISSVYTVGLRDAQERLNGAFSVLNDGINLAQGSSDTSSSQGVSVSVAIGAVYTAGERLRDVLAHPNTEVQQQWQQSQQWQVVCAYVQHNSQAIPTGYLEEVPLC